MDYKIDIFNVHIQNHDFYIYNFSIGNMISKHIYYVVII